MVNGLYIDKSLNEYLHYIGTVISVFVRFSINQYQKT